MASAFGIRLAGRLARRFVLLIWLALSIAVPLGMTVSETLFSLVSGAVGLISGGADLLTRERAKTAQTAAKLETASAQAIAQRKQLDAMKGQLARKEAALTAERAAASEARLLASRTAAELDATAARAAKAVAAERVLGQRVSALSTELATKTEAKVVYRRQRMLMSSAVSDASAKAMSRVRAMVGTDISSMAGQAVPYAGVAAIVLSTTYVAVESCQLMKDLYELDVAFNPDHAVDTTEVCGMRVPTASEIWEGAKRVSGTALGTVWDFVPDFQWEAGWNILMDDISGKTGLVTGP